tara:strand:- start:9 stop:149 length:141 start_codon:yes stop_codon:yes gene_type:complete
MEEVMEIRIKYNELKRQGLPQWQILVRLVKEFGLIKANEWWKKEGL